MQALSETVISRSGYLTQNPVNGDILHEWPRLADSQVEAGLSKAHAAFHIWRAFPLDERAALFYRIADLFEKHADRIGRQITVEMGKILPHSKGELALVASIFRYYAEHAGRLLEPETIAVVGQGTATICKEPTGVILGIEPFNAPIYQAMRVAAPNLMLGNTVIVKPAEITAGSSLMIDEVFAEAGFPAGCYQTILASVEQVSAIISDARVRGVALTGSDRAGSSVGEQAGRAIKPVILELGGSDAFVVLDSANIDLAAATAATCRLIISGQACALPKRIIVTEASAEAFIESFKQVFCHQTMGDPLEAGTTLGPMSSERAAQLLQDQYDDAVAKGATILVPGGRTGSQGAYFKPAILTDIKPGMRLHEEEAFGPLALIFRVPDADAAIAVANDSKYGLGGSVFGEDLEEARRVAAALDTGSVGINAFVGAPIEIPFGGTKSSGVGRELGRTGMDHFANIKTYLAP